MLAKHSKEEREQMVINRGNPTNSSKSKMSEYLSQDNVKSFNRIVVSRNFDKLEENYNTLKQIRHKKYSDKFVTIYKK